MAKSKRLGEGVLRSRYALLGTALFGALFIGWASVAHLDQVTRAPGKVIALSRTQSVQSPDGGVVREILVREGETVRRDQLLVRLDDTKSRAALAETQGRAAALKAALARLRAEVYGTPLSFPPELRSYTAFTTNQQQLYNRRREALETEIRALTESQRLASEELRLILPLEQTGDISASEVLRLRRTVNEAEAMVTKLRNKFFQDAQADMAKAEEDLTSVEQVLADRSAQFEHAELRAPTDGVVNLINQTTIGAVLRPGDEIMQVLPTGDDLIVEAKVRSADIGFVRTGLHASIKLDAYDYSIYGSMEGKVTYISPDALIEKTPQGEQAYYRAHIQITSRRFKGDQAKKVEVQPGMTTTVEVITGSNTVLGYIVKPVFKTLSESLVER
ncbi:HlyD family efflux transporter periplasmic adaptor subunit [Leptothrix discophora]|uniref:HlyD family efflux transporter periplasmic adaptor subunit n=1 Tax=Leptothrix discophora TaxID=89 RepID=A0ABT9G2Q1_LEPDI|nr:HlyD family efflux transporter periplasmic adaptor subunit [Leptothrix discophora]MDP4300760.1 HlyD family efflux transporter periplasmic adaptor subunit [Leptothrix discophora]